MNDRLGWPLRKLGWRAPMATMNRTTPTPYCASGRRANEGRGCNSRPASIRRTIGIIPARYASARFPGKPLALIAGKPLLQHVVERCQKAKALSEIIVATDDPRIAEAARNFSRVEMTGAEHQSGTDRVAEVAARQKCDAVLNIQGDEPLIDPSAVDAVAGALAPSEMSTAATPIQ